MKQFYEILFLASLFFFIACSSGNDHLPVVSPEESGKFVDERDGTIYSWVRYGNLEWMTQNLKYDVGIGNYKYTIAEIFGGTTNVEIFNTYGYLYTYSAAETACPEGWRLPTDEDWQALEQTMGMSVAESQDLDWRGDPAGEILQQDISGSGMELTSGGFRDAQGNCDFLGAFGFFWSSTTDMVMGKTSFIIGK